MSRYFESALSVQRAQCSSAGLSKAKKELAVNSFFSLICHKNVQNATILNTMAENNSTSIHEFSISQHSHWD